MTLVQTISLKEGLLFLLFITCHTILFSADVDLLTADTISSVGEG